MSLRRILLILLALSISGGTFLVGRSWLESQRVVVAAPPPAPVETRVLVAHGDLAAGQFIRPENLRWQAWPSSGVSDAYATEGKQKIEDYVGAVVRASISDGEPITEGRIVRPGDRGFMAAVLTPGDRAVTVPVTVASGDAGFIFPGDRVDLILTVAMQEESGAKRQRFASETLLTDLRVLAVDQRSDDQSKEVMVAKTATLEVTPKQAETIALATELGKLSLSLRSLARKDGVDTVQPLDHIWDTEATHLTPPSGAKDPGGVPTIKVSVVHGDQVKELDFPRTLP